MTNDDENRQLQRMIEAARGSGFVRLEDLDPLIDADGSNLDTVLLALADAKIQVRIVKAAIADAEDVVSVYLREVDELPALTPQEKSDLAELMCSNQPEADHAGRDLVEAHLRMVVDIAHGCGNHHVHLLDRIQAGNNGLMHAADTFDCRRNYDFSTYAAWWIRRFALDASETKPS
jgi:DNA-directed RNA polymerase sigma subunit (sigma70/sigma32)